MKSTVSKIVQINEIIKNLDPSLQEKASELLLQEAFGSQFMDSGARDTQKLNGDKASSFSKYRVEESSGIEQPAFFAGHEHDRLKDNVHLIVAWLYSKDGVFPIETKLLKETALSVGLKLPNRPDNTMRQAKCKSQPLYQRIGRGWQLTDLGERYVQQRYGIKKGSKHNSKSSKSETVDATPYKSSSDEQCRELDPV